MAANSPHTVFNCVVGAAQAGPAKAVGDTVLFFLGGNLTPGSVASALTVCSEVGMTNVFLTLGAPASGGSVPGIMASLVAINTGALFYTLSGTGASAQLYSQTG